jgi:NADPH:quinone reductase-like Zn-dependent oxidoreductase
MFRFFGEHKLIPVKGEVFAFEAIRDAVYAQESGTVNGKIVVKL